MNARFDRVVFGRQAEGIKAHRLEYLIAFHAHVARVGIGEAVVIPVPEVQPRARGVREHLEDVFLFIDAGFIKAVKLALLPFALPLFLDLQ